MYKVHIGKKQKAVWYLVPADKLMGNGGVRRSIQTAK